MRLLVLGGLLLSGRAYGAPAVAVTSCGALQVPFASTVVDVAVSRTDVTSVVDCLTWRIDPAVHFVQSDPGHLRCTCIAGAACRIYVLDSDAATAAACVEGPTVLGPVVTLRRKGAKP